MDIADYQHRVIARSSTSTTYDSPPLYRETRQSHVALLTKAIESEIIPRLIRAREQASMQIPRKEAAAWQPDADEIGRFAALVLDRDETLAVDHLRSMADRGIGLDALYDLLLGATARHLGRMWEEDEVNFTAVTIGVWRLQEIMRTMSAAFVGVAPIRLRDARILLVPAIGGQHSFGLAMVAEHFLRAGWEVSCDRASTNDDLAAMVSGNWFDVIGISVGATDQMSALRHTIATARKASRNLRIGVMVGGPVFVASPAQIFECGADSTAADARQAVIEAETLLLSSARVG